MIYRWVSAVPLNRPDKPVFVVESGVMADDPHGCVCVRAWYGRPFLVSSHILRRGYPRWDWGVKVGPNVLLLGLRERRAER